MASRGVAIGEVLVGSQSAPSGEHSKVMLALRGALDGLTAGKIITADEADKIWYSAQAELKREIGANGHRGVSVTARLERFREHRGRWTFLVREATLKASKGQPALAKTVLRSNRLCIKDSGDIR
eukprot:TRINITY_DN78094_c0_g1_i1.p1 TRINITY_DN78094_c0_g1~~TRINITY_DN78094_c0_g1_i1.p1  ORF type:complete len:125 (-),score=15.94 TRINITY_DN78094_c0_g1_i1:106-480(-)